MRLFSAKSNEELNLLKNPKWNDSIFRKGMRVIKMGNDERNTYHNRPRR